MHTDKTLKDDLVTALSKTIELFGLSTLESRLFAYLYLVDEPKTLDEMSEALGKSKTAMSTSIRSLAEFNLVSQVWQKGIRKDLYVANSQLYRAFMNFYFKKWVDKTERQREVLEEILEDAKENPEQDSWETVHLVGKLADIIEFHSEIEDTFNTLQREK